MLPTGAAIAAAPDNLQVCCHAHTIGALTSGLAAQEHADLAVCTTSMHQTSAYVNVIHILKTLSFHMTFETISLLLPS
jgi:hypothetical protein